MNDRGVCRTAPSTPGLLIKYIDIYMGKHYVTYRHFCILFFGFLGNIESSYYNVLDIIIAFSMIIKTYNW